MAKTIHIGSIIQEKLKEKGMTLAEFARRLSKTPGGVRYIFDNKGINTDLLIEVGQILEYDFFQHFTSLRNPGTSGQTKAKKKVSVLIEVDEEDKQDKLLKILGVTVKQ